MDVSKKGLIGIALMVVGTVLFIPGISFQNTGVAISATLLAAALLLTAGTYLVGTDVEGRVV